MRFGPKGPGNTNGSMSGGPDGTSYLKGTHREKTSKIDGDVLGRSERGRARESARSEPCEARTRATCDPETRRTVPNSRASHPRHWADPRTHPVKGGCHPLVSASCRGPVALVSLSGCFTGIERCFECWTRIGRRSVACAHRTPPQSPCPLSVASHNYCCFRFRLI